MAKAHPFPFAQTPTFPSPFPVLPRVYSTGTPNRTRNTQIEKRNLDQNYLGRIYSSPSARSSLNFSSAYAHNNTSNILNLNRFKFVKYKFYIHVGGLASVSAVPLFAIPYCGDFLLPGCGCSALPPSPLRPLRRPSISVVTLMSLSGEPVSSQEAIKTVKCVIKGRVQGVFYRNWTIENASQLGLRGWVRNKRDGSVEALFSGKPDAVDEMQQRCRRGPPDALVTGFEALPCTDDPGTAFERKPTA